MQYDQETKVEDLNEDTTYLCLLGSSCYPLLHLPTCGWPLERVTSLQGRSALLPEAQGQYSE